MSLRRYFRRSRWDAERASEIDAYLQIETDENIARGMSPADARAAALRKFGNPTRVREEIYRMNTFGFIETIAKDLRYAGRMLRGSPVFTAVAVASLALGIGANTALFSLIDTLLLRYLPAPHPEQLQQVAALPTDVPASAARPQRNFSFPVFEELRDRNDLFSGVFAADGTDRGEATLDGRQEQVTDQPVTGAYFSVLGVEPALGRLFTPELDKPGADAVAVLSYNYWQRRFSLDPRVLGKKIVRGPIVYTVIGVARAGFTGIELGNSPDFWLPVSVARPARILFGTTAHGYSSYVIVGRLKPGLASAQALAALNVRFAQILDSEYRLYRARVQSRVPEAQMRRFLARRAMLDPVGSGLTPLRQKYTQPLFLLMGVVGLVLLIACANIANLLLSRGAARRREVAVRLSIGASPARLFRQFLTESLLLAFAGALAGLAFAVWAGRTLLTLVLGNAPSTLHFQIDWRVLAFTAALSLATGILFGVGPAWRAVRLDVNPALKNESGAEKSRRGFRIPAAQALVVFQVAVSLVLLVGAVLFVATVRKLAGQDIGIQRDSMLIAQFAPAPGSPKGAPRLVAYKELLDRVAAIPGVRAAALSDLAVFGFSTTSDPVYLQGRPPEFARTVNFVEVSPSYFETMGTPVLEGRAITGRDNESTPKVAVVNEAFARTFSAGESLVGRRFGFLPTTSHDIEIVGVVKDVKWNSLRAPAQPLLYMPVFQPQSWPYGADDQMSSGTLAIRTMGDPKGLIAAVRQEIRDAHAFGPKIQIDLQAAMIDRTLLQEQLLAKLSGFFGGLGLLLAVVGLFGVISYTVSRRAREFGLRIALGALPADPVRAVVRQAALLVLLGLAAGAVASLFAGRLVKQFLFQITPEDPRVTILAAAILMAAAMLAAWLPARKAARVDPMTALRHD